MHSRNAMAYLLLSGCLMAVTAEEVQIESFGSTLEGTHVTIIAVALTLAGMLLVGVVAAAAAQVKIKLGVILMGLLSVVVLMVGIVAWIVTYQAMRSAIEEQVHSLLVTRGSQAELMVKSVLDLGPIINDLHRELSDLGDESLDKRFPDVFRYLSGMTKTFVKYDSQSIDMIYYATHDAYMYGVERPLGKDAPLRMMYAVPAGHRIPAQFWCRDESGAFNNDACYGKDGKGRLLRYTALAWGNPNPDGNVEISHNYNPTQRPWYQLGAGARWSPPYVSPEGSEPEFFLTATRAIRNSTGGWKGVAAVDYTIRSLHPLMKELPPTKNAVVALATVSGALASSSLDRSLIMPPEGEESSVRLVWESIPAIREPFEALRRRHGSLEAAFKHGKAIWHDGDKAILFQPVSVEGGLELVVVMTVPHEDVLGRSNAASTTALVLVLVITAVCCVFLAVLVTVIIAPLGNLAKDMNKVALMKIEDVPVRTGGIASELCWMNRSFRCMVTNLLEYKQYLPQSIMVDSEEVETEPPEESTSGRESTIEDKSRNSESRTSGDPLESSIQSVSKTLFVKVGIATELAVKHVTMVSCNMVGTHQMVSQTTFLSVYTRYVELLLEHSKAVKGVIDNVSADRVLVSFNAVIPCTSHWFKAVDFALKVIKDSEDSFRTTMGVCSGDVRCGNTGCNGLRKFNCFGPVVTSACLLERLAPKWKAACLVDASVKTHTGELFDYRAIPELLYLPHATKAMITYHVLSARADQNQEWMYTIAGEEGLARYNQAVVRFAAGDTITALSLLEDSQDQLSAALMEMIEASKRHGLRPKYPALGLMDVARPQEEELVILPT